MTDDVELPAVTLAWLSPPAFAPRDSRTAFAASTIAFARDSEPVGS